VAAGCGAGAAAVELQAHAQQHLAVVMQKIEALFNVTTISCQEHRHDPSASLHQHLKKCVVDKVVLTPDRLLAQQTSPNPTPQRADQAQ